MKFTDIAILRQGSKKFNQIYRHCHLTIGLQLKQRPNRHTDTCIATDPAKQKISFVLTRSEYVNRKYIILYFYQYYNVSIFFLNLWVIQWGKATHEKYWQTSFPD